MEELYYYNLNDNDIKEMINLNNEILLLENYEIKEIIDILKNIKCNDKQIRNILICNPFYLSRCKSDIVNLILKLKELGINDLNLFFESNPHFLNKDVFEIEEYINNQVNKKRNILDIINELENNPYVIDEIEV